MIPVIICGGFGTKLWPLSRQHKPKHFLPLIGDKSLFQLNYEALLGKFKPEEIYVSTNEDQLELAKKQAPEIPQDNYILEPEMRNTGPAIGLIAAVLYKKGHMDEPFMVIQADDLREPSEQLYKMMDVCDRLARQEPKYITGGLKPNFAIMGVDYLIKGARVSNQDETGVFKVDKFVWRSTKEQTEELIKQNNALVHTNHTCMTPKNYLNMLQKFSPELFEPLMTIARGGDIPTEFIKLPAGVQENTAQLVHAAGESLVVEIPFKWNDFGTFESISNYLTEKNLYKVPDSVVDLDGKSNFVKLDDPNKVVALIGVDDLVIIDTGDALLICPKNQTGRVGDALKEVKNRKLALT